MPWGLPAEVGIIYILSITHELVYIIIIYVYNTICNLHMQLLDKFTLTSNSNDGDITENICYLIRVMGQISILVF